MAAEKLCLTFDGCVRAELNDADVHGIEFGLQSLLQFRHKETRSRNQIQEESLKF